MTWYTAVLVRGSFVDGTLDEERLGDELFRLIEAPDAETAYRRAVSWARPRRTITPTTTATPSNCASSGSPI